MKYYITDEKFEKLMHKPKAFFQKLSPAEVIFDEHICSYRLLPFKMLVLSGVTLKGTYPIVRKSYIYLGIYTASIVRKSVLHMSAMAPHYEILRESLPL